MAVIELAHARGDGVELKGDLCLPAGAGPHPALVLVHGGAWRSGSRKYYARWAAYLARHGIGTFSVEYRLAAPDRPAFPHSVIDCRCAVQYLRGRATELAIDPERIGIMGSSAGAHLAAMVALTERNSRFASPDPEFPYRACSAAVKVVVPVYGVYDLLEQWERTLAERPRDENMCEWYLGGPATDDLVRAEYYQASPLFHASRANVLGKTWVVAWATMDDMISYQQAERFVRALRQAGGWVQPIPVVGAPHGFLIHTDVDEPGSYNAQFVPQLMRCLRAYLLDEEVAPRPAHVEQAQRR